MREEAEQGEWVALRRGPLPSGVIVAGLCGLCVLAGAGWLVGQALPPVLGPMAGLAAHAAVLAVMCGVAGLRRQRPGMRELLVVAAGGAVVWALPEMLAAGAGGHVSGVTEPLVYAALPLVVVFAAQQREGGMGDAGRARALMTPAVAGLGGAAMIFAPVLPSSWAGRGWLVAMLASVVGTGVLLPGMGRAIRAGGLAWMVSAFAAGAALAGGVGWVLGGAGPGGAGLGSTGLGSTGLGSTGLGSTGLGSTAGWVGEGAGLLVDAGVGWLTVWLLGALPAEAFAARFLLAPLVLVAGTWWMVRPGFEWTMGLGLTLMIWGTVALVRAGLVGVRDGSAG